MIRRAIARKASSDDAVDRPEDSGRSDGEGLTNGQPWLLGRVPNGYWERRPQRVAYMRWLGERLGFRDPDDWYALRRLHFQRNCGGGLLQSVFRDSPQEALRDFMPEREWHPWLFSRTPNGFWADQANRRAYMQWLEKRLGIERPDQWYGVTKADFVKNAGDGMLANYFRDRVSAAVMEYLPRRRWYLWRFASVPQGFWLKLENRIAYLDWLGKRLRIRSPEQWYGVTTETISAHYGASLVAYHRHSTLNIMREYLPEFDWKPWLFRRVPSNYWNDSANRHRYLVWLGKQMGYRRPSDWYNLTAEDVIRSGGASVFDCVYGSRLENLFRERYPNHSWQPRARKRAPSRNRRDG